MTVSPLTIVLFHCCVFCWHDVIVNLNEALERSVLGSQVHSVASVGAASFSFHVAGSIADPVGDPTRVPPRLVRVLVIDGLMSLERVHVFGLLVELLFDFTIVLYLLLLDVGEIGVPHFNF